MNLRSSNLAGQRTLVLVGADVRRLSNPSEEGDSSPRLLRRRSFYGGPLAFRAARRAFSLLELLVAMGLLSVVILTLYAMFDQTQKALHANIAQTDVMESGRSAMELIVRDIERAQSPRLTPIPGIRGFTNINLAIRKKLFANSFIPPGVTDVLHRDYPLNELFFLTPLQGNRWTSVGFFVANSTNASLDADENLGALYRYQDTVTEIARGADAAKRFFWFYRFTLADEKDAISPRVQDQDFISRKNEYRSTNSTRLLDNVIFFRVLPFSSTGIPIDYNTPRSFFTNTFAAGIVLTNQAIDSFTATTFRGSALPSAVEVELGMLSPRLWTQYTNQVSFDLKTNFLAKHIADILVFRQRIPLRTALQ